jgi:hypothetical protein
MSQASLNDSDPTIEDVDDSENGESDVEDVDLGLVK